MVGRKMLLKCIFYLENISKIFIFVVSKNAGQTSKKLIDNTLQQ